MREIVIRGASVVGRDDERRADVRIVGNEIAEIAPSIDPPVGATVLDASGCYLGPGLVDLHTHLREPGSEVAETVETGCRAAALGGFTAVVAMPNTQPAIDHPSVVRDVLELGREAMAEVAVAAAITVGRQGERLTRMGEIAALGVHLFTDDGAGVQDAGLMRQALEYAGDLGIVLAQHCQDDSLAAGGHMHEGSLSARLGIAGQPALAEEAMLARDLALVRLTGTPMHFLHLSTAGSVELIRRARHDHLPVTAEVTPHHLLLTDEAVASYDSVFKVNPPLRTAGDVEALRQALASGIVDAVATDHAPHSPERKELPFDEAPPGMLGLETALVVVWEAMSRYAEDESARARSVFSYLSWNPARIAKLDQASGGRQAGGIEAGEIANLTIFDPKQAWTVDGARLASRSRNTPYHNRSFAGKVRHTIYEGEPVVIDGVAQR
jgi:dihydroorotase